MDDIFFRRNKTNTQTPTQDSRPLSVFDTPSSPPPPDRQPPAAQAEAGSALNPEIWNKTIRGIIYALTFILPLLFTPWTFEPLEFSKQMLLFVFVTAALVAWLLKLLVVRSWKFVKTPLDLPILAFVVIYLLASVFSVDRITSFLGYYGSFSGNFFQVLFLVLFYYLVVNNFSKPEHVKTLVKMFFASIFIALVFAVLQFFGLYIVPVSFAHANSFNTVGGMLLISLFAAFAVLMSLGVRSGSLFAFPYGKVWRVLALIAAFIVLMAVNFVYAWAVLLVGILVFMIFQIALTRSFTVKNLITPLVLLILSASFLVIQLVFPFVSFRSIMNFNKLPVEIRLDYTTAMPVLKGVVTQRPILGTGPGTFLYAFSKYRGENFNQTPFWNIRFDKAPSEASEFLVGSGVLGLLSFEILSVIFLIYGLFFLFRKKDEESWNMALTLFAGFAVLWVAHFFFFFNTVFAFAYWVLIAGFVALTAVSEQGRVKTVEYSLATSPRQTVSVISAVSLSLVMVIVFLFFAFSVYASDIFFRNAVSESGNVKTYDQAQADFERAIRLNRFRPDYYLTYSEFLILRVNQELTRGNDRNVGLIQNWLATSINTARAAVDLSPANWTAWERLANLYTIARPLVAGVDQFIIDSLTRATQTDDKNPILYTELGQVYRLASRSIDPAVLGKGVDSDNDGLTDEQEAALGCDPNNPDTLGDGVLDGTKVLSGLNCAAPGQLPDSFLGRYIKVNQQNLLKAEDSFRKAIALKPDYGMAYYQLAQTLEQAGEYAKSATELENALVRFPGDLTLKFDLGRMYFNSGRVDDAQKQFQDIVHVQPTNSNALYSLAVTFERQDNLQKALDAYKKVLQLNPDNQMLKDKVSNLEASIAQPQAPTP